ncbi:MAG: hypothetical protein EOM20_11485 [Spartobacteria bacterium]|nr:hypothetical protein [Spartobacteria bacterium]
MSSDSISARPEDLEILKELEAAVWKNVGGQKGLEKDFPLLLRRAIDEVIDTPRTGRLTLDEIEKTEKTYIGTKIEILFRSFIGYPKGIYDLEINGRDVDIKNTIGSNWMIPPEAHGKPCFLIKSNEKKALCSLGLIVARFEYLNRPNRDGKGTISKAGFEHIHWLLHDHPYPPNLWERVDKEKVLRIFEPKAGTERLVRLFTEMQEVPISRNTIEGIAQQKDYMKRLRRNGGARDKLAKQGLAVLSGAYDKNLIKALGLPPCSRQEFVSYQVKTPEERKLLKEKLT